MSASWNKAVTAARSARTLLATGDPDGAVNRAYYAMFTAACVALASIDPDLVSAKSHATIIRRFGKHVVKERGLNVALGRLFAEVEDMRRAADYEAENIPMQDALEVLDEMAKFLAAVESFIRDVDREPSP